MGTCVVVRTFLVGPAQSRDVRVAGTGSTRGAVGLVRRVQVVLSGCNWFSVPRCKGAKGI